MAIPSRQSLKKNEIIENGHRDSTELALDRTILAHDRTLMAWVRTSTSLISFGFTIYKFFQYLREQGQGGRASIERRLGPREFAFLMICIGLITLLLGYAAALAIHEGFEAISRKWLPFDDIDGCADLTPRNLCVVCGHA